ncbi:MAG: InlB B-repeat-containing protein, partial [Oscillospiraceae bacterium]|nr:InlB B-repeat-containing protein [Oscillospiraceae bacterium]
TYNANGGTVSPASQTVNAGSSVTLPTPTRSGYTFSGWSTNQSGSGKVNSPYTVNGNVTLYAGWTAAATPPTSTNKYFNSANKGQLVSAFNSLLGSGKRSPSVVHHYTPAQAIDIILSYDSYITDLCNTSGFQIPKELVQSLLLRELWCLNEADDLGDALVILYFGWEEQREYWHNQSAVYQMIHEYPKSPLPFHDDSSTGLGQMFARTGISAHNNAIQIGLLNSSYLSAENWKDRKQMWDELRADDGFSIKMVYYELFNCASKNGESSLDFFNYSASQLKALLARYNGSGADATQYGNEVYEYYLIFSQYNA